MLKGVYRSVYGPLPPGPPDRPAALVLVADGVGGLDLCGTGLTYAAARAGLPHTILVIPWGLGLGRCHRVLMDEANHCTRA